MGRGGSSSSGRGGSSGGGSRGMRYEGRSRSGSSSFSDFNSSKTSSKISAGGLFLAGFIFLSIGIIFLIESCGFASVQGTCVDNVLLNGYYYTTYTYEIDNEIYINRSQEGWEYPEILNKHVVIYYKKADPNYITENAPNIPLNIIFLIVGAATTGVGIYILIKRSKSNKTEKEVRSKKFKICAYCGGVCEISAKACANCGAKNIIEVSENSNIKENN